MRPGMVVHPVPYQEKRRAPAQQQKAELSHGTIFYRSSRLRDGDCHRDRDSGRGGDSRACRFRRTRRWCRRRCRSRQPTWAATRRIWKRPSRSPSRSNWSGWTACCTTSPPAPITASSSSTSPSSWAPIPDIAAVQTQNRVNVALPRLPPEVQRQGVTVKKVSTAFLMAVSLVASDDRYDALFLTNYAQINLVNQIGSLPGVGESRLSSQQVYSMRVWLNPDKMTKLGITATDVSQRGAGAEPAESGGRDRPGALAARHRFPICRHRARPPHRSQPVRRYRGARAARRLAAARPRHRPRGTRRADLQRLQPLERPAFGQRDRLSRARRQRGRDRRRGDQVHGQREVELPQGHRLRGAVQLHHVRARRHQGRAA